MHVTSIVRRQVEDKVAECLNKATEYYGRAFEMPKILFDKRGTTAGTANHVRWEVNFNAVLLMENQKDFIERTVPHECAHLIDSRINPHNFESDVQWTGRGYRRTKRNVHGADFKFIMEHVLGADDSTRCHNYDTTNARVKKKASYEYRCTCGCGKVITLGSKRHNKEQQRPGTYSLTGHSKARLEFIGGQKPAPLPVAAQTKSSHVRPPSGSSNKDIARGLYAQNVGNRSGFIKACESAGIKKTTASTYFQNFKSGTWK